jgi:hypothetical protein
MGLRSEKSPTFLAEINHQNHSICLNTHQNMKPITILIVLILSASATAQVKLEYGERYKTNKSSNYAIPENLIKINDDRFLLIRGGKSQYAFENQGIDCFELYDGSLKRMRTADFPKKHGDKKASYEYCRYLEGHVWAFFTAGY